MGVATVSRRLPTLGSEVCWREFLLPEVCGTGAQWCLQAGAIGYIRWQNFERLDVVVANSLPWIAFIPLACDLCTVPRRAELMSTSKYPEVRVAWTTPATRELKLKLQLLREKQDNTLPPDLPTEMSLFPLLPTEEEPRFILVLGQPSGDDGKKILWNLVAESPDAFDLESEVGPKPAALAAGGLGELQNYIPLPKGGATYQIEFTLDGEAYSSSLLPSEVSEDDADIVSQIGRSAKRTQVGYRFQDGVKGITDVRLSYSRNRQIYSIFVEARDTLSIREGKLLHAADDICEVVRETLFERKVTE